MRHIRSPRSSQTPHQAPHSVRFIEQPEASDRPIWQMLLFGVVVAIVAAVIFFGWKRDIDTQNVVVIKADDYSKSGLAYPKVIEEHCRLTAEHLKSGDRLIELSFADRPEVVRDQPIQNTIGLMQHCHESATPPTIGQREGTSPTQMFTEVLTVLESARIQGMKAPAVVTVWLQAAEPVPGESPLDLTQFAEQVQTMTDNQAIVAIFGPTGKLQSDLRQALKGNPRAQIWPIQNVKEALQQAYTEARQLEPIP